MRRLCINNPEELVTDMELLTSNTCTLQISVSDETVEFQACKRDLTTMWSLRVPRDRMDVDGNWSCMPPVSLRWETSNMMDRKCVKWDLCENKRGFSLEQTLRDLSVLHQEPHVGDIPFMDWSAYMSQCPLVRLHGSDLHETLASTCMIGPVCSMHIDLIRQQLVLRSRGDVGSVESVIELHDKTPDAQHVLDIDVYSQDLLALIQLSASNLFIDMHVGPPGGALMFGTKTMLLMLSHQVINRTRFT